MNILQIRRDFLRRVRRRRRQRPAEPFGESLALVRDELQLEFGQRADWPEIFGMIVRLITLLLELFGEEVE